MPVRKKGILRYLFPSVTNTTSAAKSAANASLGFGGSPKNDRFGASGIGNGGKSKNSNMYIGMWSYLEGFFMFT